MAISAETLLALLEERIINRLEELPHEEAAQDERDFLTARLSEIRGNR